MCGIAGKIFYKNKGTIDREEILRMSCNMWRRGPDGHGEWYSDDGTVALAHRRLSIIDLSERASQPMTACGGRYVITFNGEIYNYKELRGELEQAAYHFDSDSDTEVLLLLFDYFGPEMVRRLRGMFAFVIYDNQTRTAFMARDPYGIKPLYYSNDGACVSFASQVKALLAGGTISTELDSAAVVAFFMLGSIPEPLTIRKSVQALPAGSYALIRPSGLSAPVRYFSIPEIFAAASGSESNAGENEVREFIASELLDSVRYHMIADVPVGAFLSAGMDSTSLVGLVADSGLPDLQTVTLAFGEFEGRRDDEAPLAEKVAAYYGTKHVTRRLDRSEFSNDIDAILDAMDQPSIDGVNTYFVSKAAKELGWKVAISGLGGDELFGGYNTFVDVPAWVRKFSGLSRVPFLGDAFRIFYSTFIQNMVSRSPKIAGSLKYGGTFAGAYFLRRGVFMPWELSGVLPEQMIREGLETLHLPWSLNDAITPDPRTDFGRVASLEAGLYMRNQLLRDTDWAGMAHSLELRVPLVDAFLLQRLAPHLPRLAPIWKKQLLTSSPRKALPDEILRRPKTGFQVPMQAWLERDSKTDAWKEISALRKPDCPWAKRWAYTVFGYFRNGRL